MANLQAYKNLFYRLLPTGDLWPTQDQASANWEKYVKAIMSEFQRIDAKVVEWLEDFFPDTAGDPGQLEDWERILGLPLENQYPDVGTQTESERRTEVLAALRPAAVTKLEVEALAVPVIGVSANIIQPALPVFYVGTGLAGQPLAGPGWASSYLYGYMDQELFDQADFSTGSWATAGTLTVTTNTLRAPDGTLTADTLDGGASGGSISQNIAGTANGDTVQVSVWLYPQDTASTDVTFVVTTRAGTNNSEIFILPEGRWQRIERRVALGTGATTPKFTISLGTSEVVYGWGANAGIVSPLVEATVGRQTPVHTTPLHRTDSDLVEYPLT